MPQVSRSQMRSTSRANSSLGFFLHRTTCDGPAVRHRQRDFAELTVDGQLLGAAHCNGYVYADEAVTQCLIRMEMPL